MSLDLTRHSLFKTLFYFVLLAVLFWGAEFFGPGTGSELIQNPEIGMPLGRLIRGWMVQVPILTLIFSFILVFINSFYVTRVVTRNVIYLERTYMPAILYLLMSWGYFSSVMGLGPLLTAFLLLGAIELMLKSYNYKGLATGPYLIVGMLLGLAGAIYAPALFLIVLIPIGLLIFRLFDLREWLAGLVGWFMPLFFSAYGVWLSGGDFMSIAGDAWTVWMTPEMGVAGQGGVQGGSGGISDLWAGFNYLEWAFVICAGILFVLAILTFIARLRYYKLKPLKAYIYFIWILVIWAGIMVLLPCRSLYQLPVLSVPLAVIIPTYFSARKPNFVSNLLYILLIVLAIVIHLLPLLGYDF